MASKATLTLHLQGTSDLKGLIGPRDFAIDFTNAPQNVDNELMKTVLPTDVDTVLALPAMTTQGVVLVVTDLPVDMKINSEVTVFTIAPPAPGSKGVFLLAGQPNVTQLLFSGKPQSTPKATVYVFVIGL